jgi:hypothetical protein
MKPIEYIIGCALVAALAGCGHGDKEPATNAGPPDASRGSAQSTTESTGQAEMEKDAMVASAQQELKACDAKIDELTRKAAGYAGDAKAEADKALAALREKRDSLADKCKELKQSSKETWQQVKAQFNTALSDLKKALEDAKSKFTS